MRMARSRKRRRMIVSGTGHRPPRGYANFREDLGTPKYRFRLFREKLQEFAVGQLRLYKPDKVLTGMALGWDTALAEACVRLSIPFAAVVPCDNQDRFWEDAQKQRYKELLS